MIKPVVIKKRASLGKGIKMDLKNFDQDKYIFNSRFVVVKMLNDKTKLLSPNEAMFDAAVDVADEF